MAMGPATVQPVAVVPGIDEPPKTNLAISILSCILCNFCCLGFVALIFAVQSNSSLNAGDVSCAK